MPDDEHVDKSCTSWERTYYGEQLLFETNWSNLVVYIEFIDRKSILHLIDGYEINLPCGINQVVDILEMESLCQIYKGVYINLRYLKVANAVEVKLANGKELLISKPYYDLLMEKIYMVNKNKFAIRTSLS